MATQYSTVRRDCIEYSFWLVFDDTGGMRMARGKPDIGRRERRVRFNATLPTSLFKEPELQAKIVVPDQSLKPTMIDIEAARDAIEAAIGMDVDLQVKVVSDDS